MSALEASGLRDDVLEFAAGGRPLLGICVGMQMLTLGSEEGNRPGLGLIRAETRRIQAGCGSADSAHGLGQRPMEAARSIRWLAISWTRTDSISCIHIRVICESPADSLAVCTYGEEFSAAIANRNVAGVQFHPEKSHRFGLQLLGNFASA